MRISVLIRRSTEASRQSCEDEAPKVNSGESDAKVRRASSKSALPALIRACFAQRDLRKEGFSVVHDIARGAHLSGLHRACLCARRGRSVSLKPAACAATNPPAASCNFQLAFAGSPFGAEHLKVHFAVQGQGSSPRMRQRQSRRSGLHWQDRIRLDPHLYLCTALALIPVT